MSDCSSVAANNNNKGARTRASSLFGVLLLACLVGCAGGLQTEPLVEFSTDVNVQGGSPQTVSRQLRAGTYLIEIRERDIDLRVGVEAQGERRQLGDAFLRHGAHRMVVSLDAPAVVRLTLQSIDQRTWRGAAAVRILRWPQAGPDAPPDQRLLGFVALGKANSLVASTDKASWRDSLRPFRQAALHFEMAKDLQALAEAEYQLGWVQYNLLHEFEDSRRSAEAAQAHFAASGDNTGAHRAANLRALTEFHIASTMGPAALETERLALLDRAVQRLEESRQYFADQGLETDEIVALNRTALRPVVLGDYDACGLIYQESLRRAAARGDKFHEAVYGSSLGLVAARKGQTVMAVRLYERALPLVERDRNPELYASMISNLGYALITLGEFDRAQALHTEALEVFTNRGDESQMAREYLALASIQFRSGDVERARQTVESSLPLFERTRDYQGEASALRLAGNAAAELDRHEDALAYLRRAERLDQTRPSLETTRVLIASQLRQLGQLRRAEQVLAELMNTTHAVTRADALAERARLRQRQNRHAEALADLRAADAIYAGLKLDFNRIDSSSELAMALLAAGDIAGADAAADVAVGIETRIRVSSANPELRARFLAASYAPYEARIEVDLAGLAERDPEAIWKAFRVAEGLRARSLADRLTLSGRDRALRDESSHRLRARLTGLQMDLERHTRHGAASDEVILETRRLVDETRARLEARGPGQAVERTLSQPDIPESRATVQASLPEDTAVLAYFVGDRRSHAWLLTRRELRHATLPGRRELQALVTTFVAQQRAMSNPQQRAMSNPQQRAMSNPQQRAMSNPQQRAGSNAQRSNAGSTLLGTLLDGVQAKRLLVLPDGPLHSLPFAALPLPRGQGHEQLIDRYVIGAAPSLALAMHPVEHAKGERLRVAVISDPVYTPDDRRLVVATGSAPNYRGPEHGVRLARLAYSAIEARAVVRAFEGADIIELAGFNATARRVIELPSQQLDVLHFATHAEARRDAPEQSALFLSEYAADGSPLVTDRLTAEDIARSGLRADVVVLSGCATGDGRELRGEGVLGLTYGFLGNGARIVVASLWPVEDALTARFMEEFYSAYRASGRASEALRAAQLRTRGSAASAVWSSFVVRANELP